MLKFHRVRTQEEFDKVKDFAEEFQHKVSTSQPIVVAERDGKMIGYYQVMQQPVVTLSYHPDACSPRDFKELNDSVKHWRILDSLSDAYPNGVAYSAMREDSPIPQEMMERFGLHYTGLKLYST